MQLFAEKNKWYCIMEKFPLYYYFSGEVVKLIVLPPGI